MSAPSKGFVVCSLWFMTVLGTVISPDLDCYAYTVSSNELIEKAKDLDSRTVVYRGELVVGILTRGSHSWINLNDGDNTIGVWCDAELLKDVRYAGDYKNKGDLIEVEGTFNRACPEHGGELEIHAYRVDVVRRGAPVGEKVERKRSFFAVIFFLLTGFVIIRYRRRI